MAIFRKSKLPESQRTWRTLREHDTQPHGAVKILCRDGKMLESPAEYQITETGELARDLAINCSHSEKMILPFLQKLGFQQSVPMLGFFLDFYNAELKINIEIDGPHHAARKSEDRRRDAAIKKQGIRVWRFAATWARKNPERLDDYIRQLIGRIKAPSKPLDLSEENCARMDRENQHFGDSGRTTI